MPSKLSPQQLSSRPCTWAHDVWLYIFGTNEQKSVHKAKWKSHKWFMSQKVLETYRSKMSVIAWLHEDTFVFMI